MAPPRTANHGSRSYYIRRGCRCEACAEANRAYCRAYYGEHKRVDATVARAKLIELQGQGIGAATIADALKASRSNLQKIRNGRRTRILETTERAVLDLNYQELFDNGHRVDASETWAKLDELIDLGYKKKFLATLIAGKPTEALQLRRTRITVRLKTRAERIIEDINAGKVRR